MLQHPALWRGNELARGGIPGIPTGFPLLDAELPGGGWPLSSLTEVMPAHEGIGELRFLSPALACLSRAGKHLAWIGPPYLPYAPALAAADIALSKLLIVRTKTARETLWAAEQALRANACGAVLAWLGPEVEYTALRRLQIAAEGGGAISFIFRPVAAARETSPAALRISLEAADGDLALRILKRRGGSASRPILISARAIAPTQQRSETGHARNTPFRMDRDLPSVAAAGDLSPRTVHA